MEVNKEYVDTDSALKRVGGNKGLLIKLLNQFVDGGHIDTLERSLAAEDFETAARDAHTIKGISANLSLPKLNAASLELELKLKNGEEWSGSLAGLKEIYDFTKQQIEIVTQQG